MRKLSYTLQFVEDWKERTFPPETGQENVENKEIEKGIE